MDGQLFDREGLEELAKEGVTLVSNAFSVKFLFNNKSLILIYIMYVSVEYVVIHTFFIVIKRTNCF